MKLQVRPLATLWHFDCSQGPHVRRDRGMTVLELMVVVVIVGVLAAVAVVAYKRYIRRAHASEVPLMFGELRSKQEQYAVENRNLYLDEPTAYPTLAATPDTEVPLEPVDLVGTGWEDLRVNLPKAGFYCEYTTRAGCPTCAVSDPTGLAPAGNFSGLYSAAPTVPWYFVHAACNFSDDSGGVNSEYFQRGDLQQLFKNNEGM